MNAAVTRGNMVRAGQVKDMRDSFAVPQIAASESRTSNGMSVEALVQHAMDTYVRRQVDRTD